MNLNGAFAFLAPSCLSKSDRNSVFSFYIKSKLGIKNEKSFLGLFSEFADSISTDPCHDPAICFALLCFELMQISCDTSHG